MEQEVKSKQIAVYKTGNYLVELNSSMKPAVNYFEAHTHAMGTKYTDGSGEEKKEENSLIRINILDYSQKKRGGGNVLVYYNVEPERIMWYQSRAELGFVNFSDTGQKIFGNTTGKPGYSIVTKLTVARYPADEKGNPRRYPWLIQIENGAGIKEKSRSGGWQIKYGTYVKEEEAKAWLSDVDFYIMMTRGKNYILTTQTVYMLQPSLKSMFNTLFTSIRKLIKPSVKY